MLFVKLSFNSYRDSYGVTPAHYAAQFSVKCLDRILQKSNITVRQMKRKLFRKLYKYYI